MADTVIPSREDARSLAAKLAALARSLSPAERALWERKMLQSAPIDADVQGYEWTLREYRNGSDDEHWYEEWVWIDDNP